MISEKKIPWNKGLKGTKSTNEEIERRVDSVVKYLRQHPLASRFDLYKVFVKKLKVHWTTVDAYALRARHFIKRESSITTQAAREIGLGVVSKMLDDPNPIVRLKAERAFASIHGYEAPTQTRIGNPDGSPLPPAVVAPTVNFVIYRKKDE